VLPVRPGHSRTCRPRHRVHPRPDRAGIVRDCAKRGVPGVIIESGGFAECGAEGKARQAELKQIAAESGIRLWGPNCMGLVDAVKKHVFSFVVESIWDEGCLTGDVSLVVQSGFLSAGFLVDLMSHRGVGISKACSIGNKVDVDECDVLEWLLDDPLTKAIGLYVEGFDDGRRFLDLCRRSLKPIVVLKGARAPSVRARPSATPPVSPDTVESSAGLWRRRASSRRTTSPR